MLNKLINKKLCHEHKGIEYLNVLYQIGEMK
ncbi:hypothetical protein VO54_02287 [Elizabethkingia miricola]|nr:hypothetical protein VO54_02287 [Elizabethkingia miricola]